ncbi:MAG: CPBP family intramembrane glutamic endopeptidase [Planctomycetota bacterium]
MSSFPPEADRPEEASAGVPMGLPVAQPIMAPAPVPSGRPDPMLLREVGRWGCALDVGVFVGVLVACLVFVGSVVSLPWQRAGGDARLLNLLMVLVNGVFTVVLAVGLTRWRGLRLASLGLSRKRLGTHLALGAATTVATFAVFWLAVVGMLLFWPAGYQALLNNPQEICKELPRMGPAALVGFTAVVGLWEEMTFRGFLLPRLRRLTGSWVVAVLLSSALFAILHIELQVVPITVPLFAIAVLWCGVTIWRRSLLPAIVAHFVFNLVQLLWMTATTPEWQ